jgi:hypothetical protein
MLTLVVAWVFKRSVRFGDPSGDGKGEASNPRDASGACNYISSAQSATANSEQTNFSRLEGTKKTLFSAAG